MAFSEAPILFVGVNPAAREELAAHLRAAGVPNNVVVCETASAAEALFDDDTPPFAIVAIDVRSLFRLGEGRDVVAHLVARISRSRSMSPTLVITDRPDHLREQSGYWKSLGCAVRGFAVIGDLANREQHIVRVVSAILRRRIRQTKTKRPAKS